MHIEFLSLSEEDTEQFAADFAKKLKVGDFIALYGGLGLGKTTFVRGIMSILSPKAKVSSPTFPIVHEYSGNIPTFHFDFYRIFDDENLYSTGFYDYFDRDGIIITEWSENIPFALPEKYYKITIEKGKEDIERKITVDFINQKE